jgi:hypothetical protein
MAERGAMIGPRVAILVSLLAAASVAGQPQPHTYTHWEAYKSWNPSPSVDRHLRDRVLDGAIDLHAHHGPDAYPRQWDAFEVAALAKERGLRAIVLKNHWTETAGLAYLVRKYGAQGIEVFGALSLDTPVGGVNPQAVRYFVDVEGGYGRIVWMPTHDAEHEVKTLEQDRPFVRVSENGRLLPETLEVIALVAEHGLTLATGHVSPSEALAILRAAREAGVERLIVTHPALGPEYTYMTDDELRAAVALGGYVEIVAGSLIRGGEGRTHNLDIIRLLGSEHCFVGSDSGLTGSPNHPDALALAAGALREAGFSEDDLDRLFKRNPAYLIGLDE